VKNAGEEYNCDSLATIEASYSKKRADLEGNILKQLSEYIPVKLTKNILLSSPERKFAIDTYRKKIHMDEILDKFEEVKTNSKSIALNTNNIVCNGMSIVGDGNITTQCTVYG
jgi:DNA polymerase II large subunit